MDDLTPPDSSGPPSGGGPSRWLCRPTSLGVAFGNFSIKETSLSAMSGDLRSV